MRAIDKTREQLMSELEEMRQRVADLEEAGTQRRRAEEALRESEERLRRFADESVDIFSIWDSELNLIDINKPGVAFFGVPKGELIGKNMAQLIPNVKEVGRCDKYLEVIRTGKPFSVDDAVSHPKFGNRYFNARAFKVGEGMGLVSSEITDLKRTHEELRKHRDHLKALVEERTAELQREITERKRVEEDLRQSRDYLESLANSMWDAVFAVRMPDRVIEWINDSIRMFGYKPGECLGMNTRFLYRDNNEYLEFGSKLRSAILEGKDVVHAEQLLKRKSGEVFPAEITTSLFRQNGELARVTSIVRDITERRRAEEELVCLSNAVRMSNDSIVIGDLEANIVEVNEATLRMYGTDDKADLVGKNAFDIIAPEDREKALAGMEWVLERGYNEDREYRIVTRDGSRILVEMNTALMKGADGQPTGFVAASRDITQRKQAEEEIERRAKRMGALYAIAHVLSQTLDTDELLNEALAKVLDVMDTDVGGIYLLDLQAGASILKAYKGVSEETVASIGLIEPDEEEIKRWLEWQESVYEADMLFNEANVARIAAAIENEGVRAHTIVPFCFKGIPLGALVIADRRERHFSADDIDLLRAIGNEIAMGIENARLLERMRELSVIDELTGLYNRRHFWNMLDAEVDRTQRYGRFLSLVMLDIDGFKEYNDRFGHTNGDAVLQSLAQTLKSALRKSDTAFRYGGDEFTIILPATDGDRAKKIIDRIRSKWLQTPKLHYPTLESPLGFSAGVAQFPETAETADGLVFLADAALYHAKRDGGYGVMLISDLESLTADIRSMATLDQVYALAATVDARDPYTYGHSTRVAAIAETIGKAMGLSGKGLSDLYAASLLHDIGKIGVPDAILTKPSGLVEDEWRIVKKHSAEGARIFGYVKELRGSVPMILHHHEWYDGKGYPDGLKGEKISLGARIIAVADAYDTLTTPRLYRDVTSHEEACEELRRCSGTQFDPEVVEAFCQAMNEANRQD